MDCLPGQKKWPLYRGGHYGEVAVSGGATVNYLWLTVQKWVCLIAVDPKHREQN